MIAKNTASTCGALLLFLVQLGNVFGFDQSTSYKAVFTHLDSAKPLSVVIAAIAFAVMWNSRKLLPKAPPVLVGFAVATALYYALAALGLAANLGPVIGGSTHAPLNLSTLAKFSPLAGDSSLWSAGVTARRSEGRR
jgi:SulP family sulfate permease